MGFFGVTFEDLLLDIFENIFFSQFSIINVHLIPGFRGRRSSLKKMANIGLDPLIVSSSAHNTLNYLHLSEPILTNSQAPYVSTYSCRMRRISHPAFSCSQLPKLRHSCPIIVEKLRFYPILRVSANNLPYPLPCACGTQIVAPPARILFLR